MIWEFAYWKEAHFRHARAIRQRQALTRWSERSSAGLEKDLIIGFFSIRKLVEPHKVSDELRDRSLHLQGYPSTGSPVNFMNWDRIDQNYDLNRPVALRKTVIWIANQVIHSFAFMPGFDSDDKLDYIFFNSDRTRRQHHFVMRVDKIIDLFEGIGANDPASMQCKLNETMGDYDFQIGRTKEHPGPASNNSMQRAALRAAADAGR
jgi:hypothetical protein